MNEKKALLRLSRHLELLNKLEDLPLTDDVKLSELTKDKVQQVALYKDKKADKFNREMGTPVDYLSWIAACYNRHTNKGRKKEQGGPDFDEIDQFFSSNRYPNCEVRLYFRNPDLFIKKNPDCLDVYRKMMLLSLIFANQYISQKQASGKIKGKQFSMDKLKKMYDKIGAILDEATSSEGNQPG